MNSFAYCELARHSKIPVSWPHFHVHTQGRMSRILNKDEEWAAEKRSEENYTIQLNSLSLLTEQQAEENSKKPFSPC